jgi:hypothetical protein
MKKSTLIRLVVGAIVLVALNWGSVSAQWNTNTAVNLLISSLPTADMQSAATSDGKIWIAFYHQNGGNYDMRAQLIDADGNKLLGADGMLVSNKTSGSATFVFNACVDNNDNLIISMQDERSGPDQAVIYKISQAGTHLWSPDGVILGQGLAPYSAALSGNDIVTVWNEATSNTLKMQRISAAGTTVWASPVSITVNSTTTSRGEVIANLNDKFTVVYQKKGSGISTTLYSQMFSGSGTALYSPVQISNQTSSGARYYSIAAEGDTTYYGYYVSSGFRFNSFLQRINPSGVLPWGINGSNFNTSTGGADNYQGETSISHKAGSPYVWSVCTFSDPNQTNYGVYIQKFNKVSGARQFTDQGKVVYPVSANRDTYAGRLMLADDTPMFMSYDKDYRIYATRLDASGNFAWPGNRVVLSSTTYGMGNPKGRFDFSVVGPERCSGVWTENRTGSELGYAQGISIGGLVGLDVTTQGSVPATITTGGGTLQMVATVYPATASQAVTWSIVPGTGMATVNATGLVTALTDGTVWAKATSVQDVTMSDSLLITMTNQIPVLATVVTLPADNIGLYSATLNGSVNSNNYTSSASFEWGLTAAYGNTATSIPGQIPGNTVTSVHSALSGLLPGTTYHYRCKATNLAGTANGADLQFTTNCLLPGSLGGVSGPAAVCAGTSAHVYSVTPVAGATAYVWTLPSGASVTAGSGTASVTVSYSPTAQSGPIAVYATDGTCFSDPAQPLSVVVSTLPAQAGPVNGSQVVCDGEQGITYTVPAVPGATSYSWSLPTGAGIVSGAGTNSVVIDYSAGSAGGNITVTAVNDCGSGPASLPLTIEITPRPAAAGAISGADKICAEASGVVYSVSPLTNAYGYVWTVPQGASITAGASTNQITVHFAAGASSGNISVYGTNGNCFGTASPDFAVTVKATPATPVITATGLVLSSSAAAGNQWYLGGVLIPGATAQQYTAVENGVYTVIVTIDGCASAVSNAIQILSVSVAETPAVTSLEISPNPGSGIFTVHSGIPVTEGTTLEIYTPQGTLLLRNELLKSECPSQYSVDLSAYPAGTYTVRLKSLKSVQTGRLILVK